MFVTTSQTQFDSVVPPANYIGMARTPARQPMKRRDVFRIAFRGMGILVTSFVVVFASLYTIFTWPLVGVRTSFFVKQMFTREDVQDAQATTSVILPTAVEDPTQDTDGDGFPDQEELAMGFDPFNAQPVKLDSDGDGIKDEVERTFYGTDPYKSDTDSDGYPDLTEIVNGESPLRPANYADWIEARTSATIRIPALKITAPVVWSKNPNDIEADLKYGVIHYPGTAQPGDDNNVVITGHSSFWSWSDAKYGTIFALIDQLKTGDKVFVDYTGTTYVYEVTSREITDPFDLKHFGATSEPQLTLMTCYPPGSISKRLYVITKLVGEQPILTAEATQE